MQACHNACNDVTTVVRYASYFMCNVFNAHAFELPRLGCWLFFAYFIVVVYSQVLYNMYNSSKSKENNYNIERYDKP